jgi:hypothetical protein
VSRLPGGGVGLRITGQPPFASAGYSGFVTCGSWSRCPCCAARIAAGRAEELGKALTWAAKAGHTVCMITLTMRHHLGHRLTDSWTTATTAWARLLRTHGETVDSWVKMKRDFGVLGFVRALEATYGYDFGWHPHIHAVLVLGGQVSPGMVRLLGERMYAIWEKGLARRGYTALRDSGGLDIRVSTAATEERLAEYFVKQLAVEATHQHTKEGKQHGRTPFQVLADCANGETADLEVWWEWEKAAFGRQQLTWSEGLREMAGLAAKEATDEELAAEDEGGEEVLQLPAETKAAICEAEAEAELLDVSEAEGIVGAERWLRVRGLVYVGVIILPGVAPP